MEIDIAHVTLQVSLCPVLERVPNIKYNAYFVMKANRTRQKRWNWGDNCCVSVHGLFNEPSRAGIYDLVGDAFAGGSVSEFCELSGEGRGRMMDEYEESLEPRKSTTSPAAETSDPPASAFLERRPLKQEGSFAQPVNGYIVVYLEAQERQMQFSVTEVELDAILVAHRPECWAIKSSLLAIL
jgi:hypothetical protein